MLDAREQVNHWLAEISAQCGKLFRLNTEGVFVSKDTEGQEFVVEVPQATRQVYFCAPIAELPEQGKTACLERLLQWNLYGLHTQYCTLGLEKNTNRIIMHYSIDISYLNSQTFLNVFNNFIDRVRRIKEDWKSFLQNLSLGEAANTIDGNMLRI